MVPAPTGHYFDALKLQSWGAWGQAPSLLKPARHVLCVPLSGSGRPDRTPLWPPRTPTQHDVVMTLLANLGSRAAIGYLLALGVEPLELLPFSFGVSS